MTILQVGDRIMLNQAAANALRNTKLPESPIHTYGALATIKILGAYGVCGVVFDGEPNVDWYMGVEDFIKVEPAPAKPKPTGRLRVMLNRVGHKNLRFIEKSITLLRPHRPAAIPQYFGDLGTAIAYAIAYEKDGRRVQVLFDNDSSPCWVNISWLDIVGKE